MSEKNTGPGKKKTDTVFGGTYKEGLKKVDLLIDNQESFKLQLGQSSIIITREDEFSRQKIMFSDNQRSPQYMGVLSRIKAEVAKNADDVLFSKKFAHRTDSEYFNFSSNLNKYTETAEIMTIDRCYEVDITAAYYQAAYLMGYIGKELYEHVIRSIPKSERLWLLGAIASSYTIQNYVDGKEFGEPVPKFSEIHKRAWINICSFIDEIMMDLKAAIGPGYLFYWVDGIYFQDRGDSLTVFDNIRHLMFNRMINFKTKPVEKIQIRPISKDGIELAVFKGDPNPTRFTIKKNLLKDFRPDSMVVYTREEMFRLTEGKVVNPKSLRK